MNVTRQLDGTLRTVGFRRKQAFSLIEMLVATAIFMVILVAVVGLLVSSNRGYRATSDLSDRQQEIEAAVNVLRYDLSLAGYRGTTPDGLSRATTDPTLEVEKNHFGDSDRLVVRYFEDPDRLFGADDSCSAPCVVAYEVGVDDDDGQTYLYRQELSSDIIGLVQAVERFRVVSYVRRGGEEISATNAIPDDIAAINLEITFDDGFWWRFPVGLSNEQEL